jgi:TldD protein
MLQRDQVVDTQSIYLDTFSRTWYGNSEGAMIHEERPMVTLYTVAIAREGDNVQTATEARSGQRGFEFVQGLEELPQAAAQRAVDLLSAETVVGGQYPVVLNPRLAGVFIHEAFGHLCEADFLTKNPRLLQILRPGRRFGPDELDVIDAGFLPGQRGNYRYDDEGVLRSKTYLIQGGVLQGYLHNRETAARMGVSPTGNARAVSYQYEPIVRMRNTYVDRGTATFEQMLRETDRGIYACNSAGGQTQMEQFTFSAAYAYEIVNGQIGDMLRDVVLSGNIFDTLRKIERIGDDLLIRGGAGGCGKGGQYPLAVTFGGPHIRIRDVTIGGKA